jgi:hypothetical protein
MKLKSHCYLQKQLLLKHFSLLLPLRLAEYSGKEIVIPSSCVRNG